MFPKNAIIFKLIKENESCMLHMLFQTFTKQQHNLFFNMPSFSTNYSLKSSSETLNCWTQLLLRYFGPSFNQMHFQRFHSCVWWETDPSFQHGLNVEAHWVEIGIWRRPQFLAPKPRIIFSTPSLGFVGGVRGITIMLESEISIFKCSFISRSKGKNIIDVHICVDFGTLFHKNQRFPSFWHCSPNHDRCRLLAPING